MSTAQHTLDSALDRDTWKARVERDLKGADYERRLVTRLVEGIRVEPLHDERGTPTAHGPAGVPGAAPYTRGRTADGLTGGWDLRTRLAHPDPRRLPALAREAEAEGAASVRLDFDPTGLRGSLGGPDAIAAAVQAMPAGVAVELVAPALAAAELQGLSTVGRDVEVACDPFAAALQGWRAAPEAPLDEMVAVVRGASGAFAHLDTTPIRDAGGTAVQELAWMLSTGVAWLRALTAAGDDVSQASGRLQAELSVGPELFLEVAKLRAARLLWARVTEASGAACGLRVHASQPSSGLSRRDPWVNLLRGTTAAAAGVLGGAEVITVRAFDERLGPPSPLGRRLARTTQLLLRDESHLHRLLDPAGGSWSVEQLTHDLAEAAWSLFTEFERKGGAGRVLTDGTLRGELDAAWEQRRSRVARRKAPLTGVSEFPLLDEKLPDVESVDLPALRAALGLGAPTRAHAPLPWRTAFEPWERLRDASDAHADRTGGRPVAALVALGALSTRTARTTWTENLLAAGGFEVQEVGPDDTVAAPVAVLCGADAAYADASALAGRLAAGGARVAVAGRPADLPEGVVRLHAGADVLGALTELLSAAGVEVTR